MGARQWEGGRAILFHTVKNDRFDLFWVKAVVFWRF
jgi:hypothetical protein